MTNVRRALEVDRWKNMFGAYTAASMNSRYVRWANTRLKTAANMLEAAVRILGELYDYWNILRTQRHDLDRSFSTCDDALDHSKHSATFEQC